MHSPTNRYGQPVGFDLPDWQPCQPPSRSPISGRYCAVEALDPARHAEALYHAFSADAQPQDWSYLPYGPFDDYPSFVAWLQGCADSRDPLFYTIIDNASDEAVGLASYLRIDPAIGVIEVGHIHFSPQLQRTPLATEAMYLMMRRVFEQLGYRRYEWKCDALNERSRNAAARLGFCFEGVFRQATIYKGRNRDTAWFSIIDNEWPALKHAFECWLATDNFDVQGRQYRPLAAFR